MNPGAQRYAPAGTNLPLRKWSLLFFFWRLFETNAGKDMADGGGRRMRDNRYRVTDGFWGS
jgi:hypothetical protein